jgi:hypothetical protein
MTDNVIRICGFERKSKEPDAARPRNPTEADVIILPLIRRFNGECVVHEMPDGTFVATMP